MKEKVGRSFVFGPLDFSGLDSDEFDATEARQKVIDSLENSTSLGEDAICVHGYRVLVKDRTLKRKSSVLKHARFM